MNADSSIIEIDDDDDDEEGQPPCQARIVDAASAAGAAPHESDDDSLLSYPVFASSERMLPSTNVAARSSGDEVIDLLDEEEEQNAGGASSCAEPKRTSPGKRKAGCSADGIDEGDNAGLASMDNSEGDIADMIGSLVVQSQSPGSSSSRGGRGKGKARRQSVEKSDAQPGHKAAEKAVKAAAKKAEREAKAAAKAAAKEENARLRLEERQAKKRQREEQKAQEKAEKARQRHESQAARGKFSDREVTCVVETGLASWAKDALVYAGGFDPSREQYDITVADCPVPNVVWWTHRSVLDGGAAAAGERVRPLELVALVCPAATLLGLLQDRSPPPMCYPRLARLLSGARARLPHAKRVVLVMHGVDAEIAQRWRQHGAHGSGSRSGRGGSSGSNGGSSGGGSASGGSAAGGSSRPLELEAPEDAAAWLLVQAGIETQRTETDEELGQFLWGVTRALASAEYREEDTLLSVVTRPRTVDNNGDRNSAATAWLRQLQMIGGVSEMRALALAEHYPSLRHMLEEIDAAGGDERKAAEALTGRMGGATRQVALAQKIVRFFAATDGDLEL